MKQLFKHFENIVALLIVLFMLLCFGLIHYKEWKKQQFYVERGLDQSK